MRSLSTWIHPCLPANVAAKSPLDRSFGVLLAEVLRDRLLLLQEVEEVLHLVGVLVLLGIAAGPVEVKDVDESGLGDGEIVR